MLPERPFRDFPVLEAMAVYPFVFSVGDAFALTGFAILHNVAFIAVALS